MTKLRSSWKPYIFCESCQYKKKNEKCGIELCHFNYMDYGQKFFLFCCVNIVNKCTFAIRDDGNMVINCNIDCLRCSRNPYMEVYEQ